MQYPLNNLFNFQEYVNAKMGKHINIIKILYYYWQELSNKIYILSESHNIITKTMVGAYYAKRWKAQKNDWEIAHDFRR